MVISGGIVFSVFGGRFMYYRLKKLIDIIVKHGINATIILSRANVYYFSCFNPMEDYVTALIVYSDGTSKLIVPRLEFERAKSDVDKLGIDVIAYSKYINGKTTVRGGLVDAIVGTLRSVNVESVGVEYNAPYSIIEGIKGRLGVKVVDVSKDIANLRIIKDSDEINRIKEATKITEEALRVAQNTIRSGVSECWIAGVVEKAMRDSGAEYYAFPSIVASGYRSALPHAVTSSKVIGEGEPVIVDIGARYHGYCSDLTRTFIVKPIDSNVKDVYYAVLEAQRVAINSIKPGVKASEIDKTVRSILREYGYEKFFIHSTGHGVGIEVHEPPRISIDSEVILKPGMVFTVEPGVYIEGKFGIRIEDIIVVTDTGCKLLSSFPKDLA